MIIQLGTTLVEILWSLLLYIIYHLPRPSSAIFPPFSAHFFEHELARLDHDDTRGLRVEDLGRPTLQRTLSQITTR